MQMVAILAQYNLNIFRVDGRTFQNWQVRICFLQFLEIVRSISRIYLGMTIGYDGFVELSAGVTNLDSKSFTTKIWGTMIPCNIQIHWL